MNPIPKKFTAYCQHLWQPSATTARIFGPQPGRASQTKMLASISYREEQMNTSPNKSIHRFFNIGILVLLLLSAAGTSTVSAVTFDRYVATDGDDSGNDCTDSNSPCATILHAVGEASSGDTIHIDSGTYIETGTISLTTSLTITGAGMDQTIIDGNNDHRVILINGGVTTSISDLSITNGICTLSSGGAGISNNGTLTMEHVKVTSNTCAYSGAGVNLSGSSGEVTISDSVISNNTVSGNTSGGGIFSNSGGTVTLNRVEISGNSTPSGSGGLHIQGGGTVTLTNVTVSGNTAQHAGGITNTSSSTLTIRNSTNANNKLTGTNPYTGGINNYATVYIKNSIISGNDLGQCIPAGGGSGIWNSEGYNLSSDDTCLFTQTGDQANTDPLLGPLADYGGPSRTHSLQAGSPAMDTGTNIDCPAEDQRGETRPVDGDGNGTATCDMGAFEFQGTPGSLVARSQGKYDGWVLESGEFTGKGGTKNKLGVVLQVGDEVLDKQYRTILSFGTASIPDYAVITQVVVKVKNASVVGTNPMKTHNNLVVDIKKNKFYTRPALQIQDFQAPAGKLKVGKFSKKLYSGWYKAVLNSGAYAYINVKGRTQLRLRFTLGDNDDNSADILKLYSGNAVLAKRPQLIVEYYVP